MSNKACSMWYEGGIICTRQGPQMYSVAVHICIIYTEPILVCDRFHLGKGETSFVISSTPCSETARNQHRPRGPCHIIRLLCSLCTTKRICPVTRICTYFIGYIMDNAGKDYLTGKLYVTHRTMCATITLHCEEK